MDSTGHSFCDALGSSESAWLGSVSTARALRELTSRRYRSSHAEQPRGGPILDLDSRP